MRSSLGQGIKYAYQSKWKKINLMTQIEHIYMLKMSPSQHFQVGVLWSFPSLVTEGLRDDKFVGTGEKLWKDALCRAGGGGLGTNAVNMPTVPRRLQSFQGFSRSSRTKPKHVADLSISHSVCWWNKLLLHFKTNSRGLKQKCWSSDL